MHSSRHDVALLSRYFVQRLDIVYLPGSRPPFHPFTTYNSSHSPCTSPYPLHPLPWRPSSLRSLGRARLDCPCVGDAHRHPTRFLICGRAARLRSPGGTGVTSGYLLSTLRSKLDSISLWLTVKNACSGTEWMWHGTDTRSTDRA